MVCFVFFCPVHNVSIRTTPQFKPHLLFRSPPFFGQLLMILVGIVPVDMPISRRWGAVNGALAPLESARRCL